MEDLKKEVSVQTSRPERVKKEIERRIEAKAKQEQLFLKNYDVVLNKYILNMFRRTAEEMDRSHDHRALKIVNGEMLHLRLDFLQGQAEGIKVDSDTENHSMYIWFNPDVTSQKIVFKLMYEGETIGDLERYGLHEIHPEFLITLISKKYFALA